MELSSHVGMRILFAGGGTGGHLHPALAVAEDLAREGKADVLFLGTARGVESAILRQCGMPHRSVQAVTARELRTHPVRSGWKLLRGMGEARRHIGQFNPDVVVGLGGYPSVPAVLAACRRRIPVILLEQNVVPGWANTMLARCAQRVCVPCADALRQMPSGTNCVVTGNPVRREIALLAAGDEELVVSRRTLLVLGGSQGSSLLNRAVVEALQRGIPQGWYVVHQTGGADADGVRGEYARLGIGASVEPFIEQISRAYAQAGLIVCRGGGTTLAELACVRVPAIVVPMARSARNHQLRNARWYAACGAAVMLDETEASFSLRLWEALVQLMDDSERRRRMVAAAAQAAMPNAAEEVARCIREVIGARRGAVR